MKPRSRQRLRRVVLIALQMLVLIIVLIPFFWMFSVSLKPANEPFAIPARLWPDNPTIENYKTAFQPEFRRYFLNSAIISLATIVISISVGLLAAYSFSRFQIRGFGFLLVAIILAQMFPVATIIIPIFKMVREAGLLNTYFGLIIAYITITLPVSIWMLLGFIGNIPPDLEESAMIDGASRFQAFWKVVVPLARPGIVATAVWIVVVTWQEFMFALAFTQTREMRTVSVGMNDYIGQYGIRYGELMASSVMFSIPIVVVFFILQRQFVAGLTAGATKG
ncbi:MAG: carbohydrate ABC transporter permease [Chloroflexota bacterium]|nr:carbohydrate ABC transporter permease [Chloroflexota bacterium]